MSGINLAPSQFTAPVSSAKALTGTTLGDKHALDVFLRGGNVTLEVSDSFEYAPGETGLAPDMESVTVPSNALTEIFSYTVPANTRLFLQLVESSLDAVGAEVTVLVDGNPKDLKRTWWGHFNLDFSFRDRGLPLEAGAIVSVTVLHNRPFTSKAQTRLFGVLKNL